MNLARNTIDFVELFQFGRLHTQPWYELLNAGFRVVGLAGSDFPANMRPETWPRIFPLLGPERALVKAVPGEIAPGRIGLRRMGGRRAARRGGRLERAAARV